MSGSARLVLDDEHLRRRRLRVLAAGFVLLLLAGLVVALALEHRDRQRLAQLQRPDGPALATAASAAHLLFSYDASRLEDDLDAALPLTTAPYTARYRAGARDVLWPAARADQAVVTADVVQVGATRDTTAERLVALVLLDRSTLRAGAPTPTVDAQQLRMTLVRRSGTWRVSGVESL